jgi:ribosomal protein L11 methyltransferase
MPFLQLTLHIGAADPEPFEDLVLEAGAVSITLEDAGDDPVLEPAPGTTPLWPSVNLKALFDADTPRDDVIAALESALDAMPEYEFATIEDRAWEREWLKDFRPMRFGQRLWICPGGQLPPADEVVGTEPLIVELDPGLAFGTGTHPTTALCLEWLDGTPLEGRRIIDYGCGSGVLAIAALKLGADAALAVDIDPQAVQATRDNAERNNVESLIETGEVSLVDNFDADILLANILAEPLKELAPRFAAMLAPGARIVLSGILASQASDVASRYAPWFDISLAQTRDDWVRLDGTRRPA